MISYLNVTFFLFDFYFYNKMVFYKLCFYNKIGSSYIKKTSVIPVITYLNLKNGFIPEFCAY